MIPSAIIVTDAATAASPLVGRLAFAGVFAALIIWLLVIPRTRLADPATATPKPVWKQPRLWALLIAALQCAVYLLWN